ncbi:hypothetical protein EC968_009594 [Mortierella alpina]|nr:hypothetical protein EC968_009594 [Mortierella alpina]
MELELFGSSGSDSDSEIATKDVKFGSHSQEFQFGDFEERDHEADPIFDSIMACTEDNTIADEGSQTPHGRLPVATPQHSPHPSIPGLCLHTNVLSHDDQSRLMNQITEINIFKGGQQNQAMRYGQRDLAWISWLEERLKQNGVFSEPFCRSDWTSRAPLFDQSIMNLYRPGDGIKPHVDLARFEDGIVIVSLLSAINMDFYRSLSPMSPQDPPEGVCQPYGHDALERQPDYTVRLEPGSVITMEGESRYEWEHGIQEVSEDLVNGERVKRKIRETHAVGVEEAQQYHEQVNPSEDAPIRNPSDQMDENVVAEHFDDRIDSKGSQEVPKAQQDVPSTAEHTVEAFTKPADILPEVDLNGELQAIKTRLELGKLTETLLVNRVVMSEKLRQHILLHINDSRRLNLQAEIMQVSTDSRPMEHQWITLKDIYHRDFVVAAAKAAAAAKAKAVAEQKAQTEQDIALLKGQIAVLQKQLDAIRARRKQMSVDAEEQRRLLGIPSILAEGDQSMVLSGGFGGGGGGGGALQCPSSGFFCESTLLQYSRILGSTPQLLRGGGGGAPSSRYYVCAARDARPVPIATCPQGGCQKDYCIGGGPARVPPTLTGGDGLYCGKTIMEGLRDRGGGSGGIGGGGGGGVGPDRPRHDEYSWNNLYYFVGSQGVNLGRCPNRCVSAAPGVADYCA